MRSVIVAGNWKMHTTPAEAGDLAALIASRTRVAGVVRVLCPPFVCLAAVGAAVANPDAAAPDGSGVWVGAQNLHHEAAGAYTGEVSATMLAGLADWVLVGHSERRRDAAETDALIAAKLARAWAAGIRPILCVGETLGQREAGSADRVVAAQLRGALATAAVPGAKAADPTVMPGVKFADPAATGRDLPWLTVAYEPVWAIGTGRNARGSDAAAMATGIRRTLDALGLSGVDTPILYGGSVTSSNIDEFMLEPEIDGALVGGASLKPDEMAGIVARAGLTAAARAGHS